MDLGMEGKVTLGKASVQQVTFEPRDSGDWDAAFAGGR